MKTIMLGAALMATTIAAVAQPEKPVDSRITNVTVFLSQAQVTREVKTHIDAGKTNIVLTGLTSQLDQQSIQVSGKGNFILLGIAHQQNFLSEFNLPKTMKALRDSLEATQRTLSFQQSEKEILNKEEQLILSNQKIGGTNQNLTAAELKAMADFYRTRLTEIMATRLKLEYTSRKLEEKIAKLQRQLDEQNAAFSQNTSEIVVSVSAEAATAVELDVHYLVANAGWTPVYDLRAINTKSPVTLNYKANVFQGTGEDWKNVKLKLSTANPNLGGLKPELYPWYLNLDQPVAYWKMKRADAASYRAMAPAVAEEDKVYDSVGGAQTVADFTTTIQTTLNTEFNIALPYTVSASNKPTLVDIRNYDVPADYLYSVAPKLDLDAFLLARLTGWEDFNLLPGEANVFFEGTFVAKTFIDPNSIKDTLNISLGRDKRIIVKREKLKDFSARKFIGANQRDSYAYEISVRNTKPEPIKLVIEDQIPVSQNNQIEITASNTGGSEYHADTGKMTWQWSLKPNENKATTYSFEIKYPKDKIVAGL